MENKEIEKSLLIAVIFVVLFIGSLFITNSIDLMKPITLLPVVLGCGFAFAVITAIGLENKEENKCILKNH